VARREGKSRRISIFKGREAKLNRAIFHILALKGPLTIYKIHKEVKTRRRLRHVRYASVNKRVRSLEKSGYIKKIGVKKTKAGFKASIYELNARAYLAILLDSIKLEDIVKQVDEATASATLAAIIHIICPHQ
jgi:DNA-binding Lrp family transcriptional regulator